MVVLKDLWMVMCSVVVWDSWLVYNLVELLEMNLVDMLEINLVEVMEQSMDMYLGF